MINILSADRLIANPQLYATFLLWMLSELFEKLPEIGDPGRTQLRVYRGGHMFYIDAGSRKAFTADAGAFYQGTQ